MEPLPFDEAIAWADGRGVVLPEEYYGMLRGLARSTSFSIAGIASLDQLQQVMDTLTRATDNGMTFAEWKKLVQAGSIGLDLPLHRLDNIFRTNIQGHYARGRCEQQRGAIETHPWRLYDAVNDSRTRPSHAAMDGFVARYDDPIWNTWTPPNGYRCRCRVIALTEREVGQYRKADSDRMDKNPDLREERAKARNTGPDAGWGYSVCQDPDGWVDKTIAEKVAAAAPALAAAAAQVMAKPPWVFLEGSNATLREIKLLGEERLNEILALVTPDDRTEIAIMVLRNKSINELLTMSGIDDVNMQFVCGWLRKQIMAKAAEVRGMGGVPFSQHTKSGAGFNIGKRVGKAMPDDWVVRANNFGPVRVHSTNRRGMYKSRDWYGNKMEHGVYTDASSTAEHEFAHHVQASDPEHQRLFAEEHKERTNGDPLEILYAHAPNERGRPDRYVSRYTGREYFDGPQEVMSMGYQALFGTDDRANLLLAKMLIDDQEMLRLLLGNLFHYKPRI